MYATCGRVQDLHNSIHTGRIRLLESVAENGFFKCHSGDTFAAAEWLRIGCKIKHVV